MKLINCKRKETLKVVKKGFSNIKTLNNYIKRLESQEQNTIN